MYLGSQGDANGVYGLLDAFDMASNEITGERPLRLRLVGDGSQQEMLKGHAGALRSADRIVFESRIPRDQVVSRAREADALIVNIEDLPVYRFGISLNKLYDYLASGRPTIIASGGSNNPVADAGAGICVPAGEPMALAQAMRQMSDLSAEERLRMGERGVNHVRQTYTYEVLGASLDEALSALLSPVRTEDRKTH
jgi:glycosyltransferase involved in cell wall biosynthesis